MDILASGFLLILESLAVAALLSHALGRALRRRDAITLLVVGLTALHEVVLVLAPVFLSVVSNFKHERAMLTQVLPFDLVRVMTAELLFVALFLLSMYATSPPGAAKHRSATPFLFGRGDMSLCAVLCVIGLIQAALLISSPVTTLAEVGLGSEMRDYSGLGDMLWQWVVVVVWLPSVFAGAALAIGHKIPRWLRALGSCLLLSFVVLGLVQSLRGRITWPIFAVLGFALISKGRKTISSTAAAALLLCVPVFGILGSEYFRTQMRAAFGGQSSGRVLRGVASELAQSGGTGYVFSLIDLMTERAQGPRNSAVLFQLHDQGEGAGLRPLFGALVFPIPRVFWRQKPIAGSIDATPYGAAIYIAEKLSYGAPYYTMGPVLASSHAYWEGGWFGVCIGGCLTGIIWSTIIRSCQHKTKVMGAIIAMIFMSSLLIDGMYSALVPIYSLIRVFWLSYLPIIALHSTLAAIGRFASAGIPKQDSCWRYAIGPGRMDARLAERVLTRS